jgi:hypothetical protein
MLSVKVYYGNQKDILERIKKNSVRYQNYSPYSENAEPRELLDKCVNFNC